MPIAHEGTYLCYRVGIDGIGHDLYFSKTTGVFLRKQLTLKSTYTPKTLHLMPKFYLLSGWVSSGWVSHGDTISKTEKKNCRPWFQRVKYSMPKKPKSDCGREEAIDNLQLSTAKLQFVLFSTRNSQLIL